MTKSRKVNDLTQLPELFITKEPEVGFELLLEDEDNKPKPVPDLKEALLDLMSNYHGWTVGDAQHHLGYHPEAYLLPTIMSKYAADGKFEVVRKNGILVFTMKKKVTETTITRQAFWANKEPQNVRLPPNPKGLIRPEEGMDIGIWKVMSDYKPRTALEIRNILAEYKFDSRITDRRIDTLIRSNRWFERRGKKGSGTAYTLRKDFPMPSLLTNTDSIADQTKVAQFDEPAVTKSTTIRDIVAAIPVNVNVSMTKPEEAKPMMDHAATMHGDDSVVVLIWKAMSDYKPYKTSEVATLIQAIRPEVKTIAVQNMMSTLKAKGWFIKSESNTLTLRRDQKLPVPKGRAEKTSSLLEGPTSKQEEPAMASQVTQTPPPPTSLVQVKTHESQQPKVALLDLAVKIKGQVFTLGECRQLVHELRGLGYGRPVHQPQTGLVSRSITIKGIDFTEAELEDVVRGLTLEGLTLANK